jgi:diaminobutyrate-2-oxoglutarate transaminase
LKENALRKETAAIDAGQSEEASETTFERLESGVRSYSRSFPTIFRQASNATLIDTEGRPFIDFLSGCSTLNYGHNDPDLKQALVDYISEDGIAHGLDMYTEAKERFLKTFEEVILEPRGLDYRVQFPGPTGANAVEAALKLARKVTGRTNIIAFTNGFHGMTLGALAATGQSHHRGGAGVALQNVSRAPYAGYFGPDVDTVDMLEQMLADPSSGIDEPAAILVETVQGEGGLNVASPRWLRRIAKLADKYGALLIVDDIQAGCGRTGTFFSFEESGVRPDIVTLAKSLSGFGLPLAVTLMKPELDEWKPGEHNGTFRGNAHAFVTATAALEKFWRDEKFENEIRERGRYLAARLTEIANSCGDEDLSVKGRGMFRGIDVGDGDRAAEVVAAAFDRGLVIETSGGNGEVVKVLAPLSIEEEDFTKGLDILADAMESVIGSQPAVAAE